MRILGMIPLSACLFVLLLVNPTALRADEKPIDASPNDASPNDAGIVCFASDNQVKTGETILCTQGKRSFYESLETLYRSGWVLKAKVRIRNQHAHAFYLERG